MSEPRTFALHEVVTREVMLDESQLRLALDVLSRDLTGSIERQGYRPLEEIDVSGHAEMMLSTRPLPQSWLDWLLRRPLRYRDPLFVIRMSVLCVQKETADAR